MTQLTGDFHINNGPAWPGQLIVEVERIDVSTNLPKADDNWSHVDTHGHFHAYDQSASRGNRYPTLDARIEHRECDGSCGGVCEGEGYDVTRYSCRICGEEIQPGTIPGPHYESMPGPTSWQAKVSVPVEQVHDLVDALASVRIDTSGGGSAFGVAKGYGFSMSSSSPYATLDLVGVSPLGRSKATVHA